MINAAVTSVTRGLARFLAYVLKVVFIILFTCANVPLLALTWLIDQLMDVAGDGPGEPLHLSMLTSSEKPTGCSHDVWFNPLTKETHARVGGEWVKCGDLRSAITKLALARDEEDRK